MKRSRVVVVALCGVLGQAGCGGGDDDGGNSPEDRADAPAATGAPEETAEGAATETPATTEEPATEALAQTTVESRTSKDTTLEIAVRSLAVEGELAKLELSFTPHSSDPDSFETGTSIDELHAAGGGSVPLVTLVDTVNLKRYLVVRDSNDNALETDLRITRPELDATAVSQHTFAAPPPDVTKIDVSVGDFTTFNDVPIAR
jgi:hypothetical protein